MGLYIRNASKPKGFLGRKFIRHMNKEHKELASWGFSHIELKPNMVALDIGCGGGLNIATMLDYCKRVDGIDYSSTSVKMSKRCNRKAIPDRCNIYQGSVSALPFTDESYDLVTAFETVYYWPNIVEDFRSVWRILRPDGQFLIVCEDRDPNKKEFTDKIPGMRIYSENELTEFLKEAGFKLDIVETCGDWVCIAARK